MMERPGDRPLGAVSRLLEFYAKDSLHRLFLSCRSRGVDVQKAFVWLDQELIGLLASTGEVPFLNDLAATYAREHDLDPDLFIELGDGILKKAESERL